MSGSKSPGMLLQFGLSVMERKHATDDVVSTIGYETSIRPLRDGEETPAR